VNTALFVLNWHPELYGDRLLGDVIPLFAERAARIRPYFEAVVKDKSSTLSDDAAYMLGWLAYHQGHAEEALNDLSVAMVAGNKDYGRPAAMRQIVRILMHYTPLEQMRIVEANPTFVQQPAFWYVAARSAFRAFDYATAMQIGERGLMKLNLPIDRLPASTDPEKIADEVKKIVPPPKDYDPDVEGFDYTNAVEIPYIVEASREILRYEDYLKSATTDQPDKVEKRARDVIVKYSMLLDRPERQTSRAGSGVPIHKDLRQALHLIDVTLASLPRDAAHAKLREWLYYRRVRILVQFDPASVGMAVAAMQAEFPTGELVNNALAEEIFAEGVQLKHLAAAEQTFHKLLDEFPKGNAVDNGYTWMAIIYRCMGRAEQARKINAEIMHRFPASRHATLAAERMAHPEADACGLSQFKKAS